VLYRYHPPPGAFSGFIGVDRAGGYAYLSRTWNDSSRTQLRAPEVALVALSETQPDQPELARWPQSANFRVSNDEYRARTAPVIEATGRPLFTIFDEFREMAVSHDAILFQNDGHVWMEGRGRTNGARQVDVDVKEAYWPTLSPEGSTVAFIACPIVNAPHCPYALYLRELSGNAQARVADVMEPEAPMWSRDGRFVYAISKVSGCLYRVNGRPPYAATKLHCASLLKPPFALVEETSGVTGVIGGHRTPDSMEYVWLDLPSGQVRATMSLDGNVYPSLGPAGLVVASPADSNGGYALDFTTHKMRAISRDSFHEFAGDWDGERIIAMRRHEGPDPVEELVSLDVRAAIGE
jgi:hypothetical protein